MHWRRWFGGPGSEADAADVAVVAIERLRRDQAEIEARLGVAEVDAAVLRRAVRDQRRLLDDAAAQIARAHADVSSRAGDATRHGDGPAAAGFRQAADGFASQLQVVRATRAQLDRLDETGTAGLDRTRALLRASAASLHRALVAEVDLLARLERLARERVIAETRRRGPGSAAQP